MSLLHVQSLVTLLLSLSVTLVVAQSNSTNSTQDCTNSVDREIIQALTHPNATGSYSRPGFTPQDNKTLFPTGDWTYNTAVYIDEDDRVSQQFWVETPNLKDIKPDDVPFSVCAIAFVALPREVYSKGQNDTGDCLSTLNSECVDALKRQDCTSVQYQVRNSFPPECTQFSLAGKSPGTRTISMGSTFLGPRFGANNDTAEVPDCDLARNNTMHPLFGTGKGGYRTASGVNDSVYDEAIYRVTPVLAAPIYNSSVTSNSAGHSAELICMRAKEVQPGSRSPPALSPSPTSIAGRYAVSLIGVVMAALVTLLLG